jgi:23S rRNA G2445 N2-methylase RlmL
VRKKYDVVLTNPPYGQFSIFSNQWLGFENAKQIDNMLMGGRNVKQMYNNIIITDYSLPMKGFCQIKSMPLKNSPSNKAGCTKDTMAKEYIVAMLKQ